MKTARFLPLVALAVAVSSCSHTDFRVVRHAERLNSTDDSPLNPAGLQRAQALATTLADKNIRVIYVSEKRRTQQTAQPTADGFVVTPIVKPQAATDELIAELRQLRGKNILVVRHSDEIHRIVNALSPNDTISPIGDGEFDNLFVVHRQVFLWQRTIRLERLKYGNP